jgi:hypothetical protein
MPPSAHPAVAATRCGNRPGEKFEQPEDDADAMIQPGSPKASALKLLDLRLGSLAGVTCLLITLPLYRSFSNRPILDRWSYSFGVFAALVAILWLTLTARSGRAIRRRHSVFQNQSTAVRFTECAVLAWGAAYLISALYLPANAARVLDFDFFGSLAPASALLEWLTLVLLSVGIAIRLAPVLKTKWQGPALALLSLLFVLLSIEGAARAKAILAPATQGFPTYSSRIWEKRYVKLNSLGFRDREHSINKPNGDRRLLVVGDSYAFGVGLKDANTRLGERLAIHLAEGSAEHWVSINASRGNTHTLEHIEFLRQALDYKPDIVILLYVFNDIDYIKHITPRGAITDLESSRFGRLHPARVLFLNSYAFQETYARLRHFNPTSNSLTDPYADTTALDTHLQDVKRFAATAMESGALTGVVPFDVKVALGGALQERYDTFVRRATAAGITVWPIDSIFQDQNYRSLIVNALDHHPNERSQEAAALQLATRLGPTLHKLRAAR